MPSLTSVNVGLPKQVDTPTGPVRTAIFKSPTAERVRVEAHNIDGDRQADLTVHGGEHKAVYGYPSEHYPRWSSELDRDDLVPGQFGENLTTVGMLEENVGIGDRYSVGSVVLQVTQPRIPCFKLGLRMNDPGFVRTFLRRGRTGFYFRVVETGELGVGDDLTLLAPGATGLSVHDVWNLTYGDGGAGDSIELALEIQTLGDEWRTPLLRKLGS